MWLYRSSYFCFVHGSSAFPLLRSLHAYSSHVIAVVAANICWWLQCCSTLNIEMASSSLRTLQTDSNIYHMVFGALASVIAEPT